MTSAKTQSPAKSAEPHNPLVLRVYLYYRLILGCLLWVSFIFGASQAVLGNLHPKLFEWTSVGYVLICLLSIIIFSANDLAYSIKRISAMLLVDLIALMLMIHASEGLSSSLSYLLLINVAMASIFIRGQLAFAFAALTSLLTIAEAIYLPNISESGISSELFAAGTLGILIFVTATSFHYLTDKIRQSDIEAAAQAKYAGHLQKLAQHIVTRMRTGVVVVDENEKIELINQSALQLMDLPAKDYTGKKLSQLADFGSLLDEWRLSPELSAPRQHALRAGQDVRISFANLDAGETSRTILYLEDFRTLAQQLQQLKLASLGRLTASIAHEVRNPLGAISHASQLLREADYLNTADSRLIEIILQHSGRVNQIIENTLAISRRKEPSPKTIILAEWLPQFINEYQTGKEVTVGLSITSATATAKFDPVHLSQVITNLCDNGARFSFLTTGEARVNIHAGISDNDDTAFIEIIDDGPGVDEQTLEQIFDPFYTTDEKGSGLGLYISRELCEINQATLYFKRDHENKSCFRIDSSHHQRMI